MSDRLTQTQFEEDAAAKRHDLSAFSLARTGGDA